MTILDDTHCKHIDKNRQVHMQPLVPMSAIIMTPWTTLVREGAYGNWSDKTIATWRKLFLLNFYKDDTKMLIATELGVAEDLGTILQSMEEHLDEFEDHLCEKTGKVYISWKKL